MAVIDTKPPASRTTALAPIPEGDWISPIQVTRTVHHSSIEFTICARPGWPLPGFPEQAKHAYRKRFPALHCGLLIFAQLLVEIHQYPACCAIFLRSLRLAARTFLFLRSLGFSKC